MLVARDLGRGEDEEEEDEADEDLLEEDRGARGRGGARSGAAAGSGEEEEEYEQELEDEPQGPSQYDLLASRKRSAGRYVVSACWLCIELRVLTRREFVCVQWRWRRWQSIPPAARGACGCD